MKGERMARPVCGRQVGFYQVRVPGASGQIAADTSPGSLARRRAAKVHGRVNRQRQGSLL